MGEYESSEGAVWAPTLPNIYKCRHTTRSGAFGFSNTVIPLQACRVAEPNLTNLAAYGIIGIRGSLSPKEIDESCRVMAIYVRSNHKRILSQASSSFTLICFIVFVKMFVFQLYPQVHHRRPQPASLPQED